MSEPAAPQDRYAEKIRALLAKAESTTPEEAEALISKAQELMTRYAISEAMIAEAAGKTVDEIEQREVILVGNFHERKAFITYGVAAANSIRCVYRQHGKGGWQTPLEVDGKEYKIGIVVTLTGFRSDVERALLLDASLQVQCSSALNEWVREHGVAELSKTENHRERKQFISSFANAVRSRLVEAKKRGEREAVRDEMDRTRASETDASESVALVLRSRKDRVDDWMDETYGKTLRTVSRSYGTGSWSAADAGTAAGRSADIGQSRVSGRRGLPS